MGKFHINQEKIMSLSHWMMIATLAASPLFAVAAQESARRADPANPAEVVPAPAYESVFVGYQASGDFKESPDKIWRSANDALGGAGNHAGHTQETPAAREPQSGAGVPATKPGREATPASAPSPADHGMHHKNEGK